MQIEAEKPKRKKILIVTGVLWIGGGAEKVAAALGNHLTEAGYETHLLTFYEAAYKYPYFGIYHSFNEAPKHRLLKALNIPFRIYKIAKYAKRHKIDVAVTFLEEANFYTLIAKRLFLKQLPVIVSVRNNIRQRSWIFKKLSALLYPQAEKVVSVTKTVEAMLIEDFDLKNTTTIYNPLDMELINDIKKKPLPDAYAWLSEKKPLLISAGRLIDQKAQWHLIRAFSEVAKRNHEVTLALLGEGVHHAALLKLIDDCGVRGRVHLLGKHANVYQFMNVADVFVFSSRFEGMPNTMLEALSVGLPIISPDCQSGPREILAPEVGVRDELTYPYETAYGVLTAPFPIVGEPIWQSPEEVPLTPEEEQLRDAMVAVLAHGWVRGPKYTEHKKRVAEAFALPEVMKEWEEIVL